VRAKVPLLEHHHGENDNDTILVVESEDVTKYIGQYLGTNDEMYPKDKDSNRRVRIESFIQAFEKTIQGYYQFMTATNPEQVDAGKLAFCHALHALAPLLMIPGETTGPFCLGETFSVAECYAAPWVHRYRITVPFFRGVTMREVLLQLAKSKSGDGGIDDRVDKDTIDSVENKVTAWMDAVWNRPSVQATNGPDDKLLSATRDYFVKYVTPNSPAAAVAAEAAATVLKE
jgi:glutathione S-transferase